jgi:hypothetical protein
MGWQQNLSLDTTQPCDRFLVFSFLSPRLRPPIASIHRTRRVFGGDRAAGARSLTCAMMKIE